MPPKRSDVHHIAFHFSHSTVLLSVPDTTTIEQLKKQLLPALEPLRATFVTQFPSSSTDLQLFEPKSPIEGADANEDPGLRNLDEDEKKTIRVMGWNRWAKLFVSFRGEDGEFPAPEYTLPSIDDGQEDDEMEEDVQEVPASNGKGKGRAV